MPSRRSVTSAGPGITVEKIELPPIPPPVETPPGKPVTGLKEVRLLHNLIVPDDEKGSRLIPRGEIIDIDLVPERLRTNDLIEAPDAFREGKVMLLHDMIVCMPNFEGDRTVWREKLFSAYSLVDLVTIPNRIVEGMREGEDYLSEWNEDERKVKEYERHNATEESQWKGGIPDDVSAARDPHNRYGDSL